MAQDFFKIYLFIDTFIYFFFHVFFASSINYARIIKPPELSPPASLSTSLSLSLSLPCIITTNPNPQSDLLSNPNPSNCHFLRFKVAIKKKSRKIE